MGPAARGPAWPPVRRWRRRFRRARRGHHDRSRGEIFSDLYTLLWFVAVYGTALYTELGRVLDSPAVVSGAAERIWLGLAALAAAAGLLWMALRSVGPMLATDAERSWIVTTPLDRRGWLTPRFVGLLNAGGTLGALAGFGLAVVSSGTLATGPTVSGGALMGLTLPAGAVTVQRSHRRRLAELPGVALVTVGAALATLTIWRSLADDPLPAPHLPETSAALVLAGLALAAGGTVVGSWTTLPRLDRRALGTGAPVAAAAVTSAIWLDPRLLGEVLDVRRWRRVGRIRSRTPGRSVAGLPRRFSALLRAEALRLTRRPGVLAAGAGLALVHYAVAVTAPSLVTTSRVVLAYLVMGRLMAGLRAIARSPGLRRSLGGTDGELHLIHLVLPSLGAAIWWMATEPTSSLAPGVSLLLLVGVIGAAYRAATRGPPKYDGAVIETPFGLVPVDLIVSLARGPDLLGGTLLTGALLG